MRLERQIIPLLDFLFKCFKWQTYELEQARLGLGDMVPRSQNTDFSSTTSSHEFNKPTSHLLIIWGLLDSLPIGLPMLVEGKMTKSLQASTWSDICYCPTHHWLKQVIWSPAFRGARKSSPPPVKGVPVSIILSPLLNLYPSVHLTHK